MNLLSTLAFISTLAVASAGCPAKCSGHGTCGIGDTCSCQPRWIGPDCGSRECPYGVSWVTSSNTENAPSGTKGTLAEGTLPAQTAAATGTTAEIEARHYCGADDCSALKGKSIQFMNRASAHTVDTTSDAGGIWGRKTAITAFDSTTGVLTFGDAEHTPAAGSKYRITGSGGMTGKHEYTECSSKGACDRSSGECACFDGYEGRGCRRQACPNACSGHGRCASNDQVNPFYGRTASHSNEHVSQYWDYKKTRQCLCDRGWEGYDCASRICPKGDDPLTDCDNVAGGNAVRAEISDIQKLSFPTLNAGGFMTLTFTDMFNGIYTTKPIELVSSVTATNAAATAQRIEDALEELPNFVTPNVTVTSSSDFINEYHVTFVDDANAGRQHLLLCSQATADQKTYNDPSVQPRFTEPQLANGIDSEKHDSAVCAASHIALTAFNAENVWYKEKEHAECSNRGNCDASSGVCNCFEGFSGEACATQTVFF